MKIDNTIIVRLTDDTVGFCVDGAKVGDIVECWLHDENGNIIAVIGEVAELM